MLKKSLSLLLGFILLVSTIPTTVFADSASLSALPEEMLNDIIDDGELVLADFSDITTAQQELESLVSVTSTDGATASISAEHLMSTGATSALKLSNLTKDSVFYINSKYGLDIFPGQYSIRLYFGIKNNGDSTADAIPFTRWLEIGSNGQFDATDKTKDLSFTMKDNTTGHDALNREFVAGNSSLTSVTDIDDDLLSAGNDLRFGFKTTNAKNAEPGNVKEFYIEKITALMPDYNKTTLVAPTATVADGGVYTISDSYNSHSFTLDFAEDVYMAPDAVTVTSGESDITEDVNPTLSGNTLNLTFPSDIDYSGDYKILLAKSKVRGATGKTLLADAEYNFTWNVVKMPLFTDCKLVLADFTNNPTQEYIDSVITNASDDITVSTSSVHYSSTAESSLEIKATSDGTFYVKSAYSKDLWPDEYKIYVKFGTVAEASKIRFEASAGLGDGALAKYTSSTGLSLTLNPENDDHLAGTDRVVSAYANINEISSSESEVTIRFNIKKSTAFDSYNDNNKFYIEQIYLAADCQPLSYPIPSIDYGDNADGNLFGDCEYTLSFGTELHYGEDALTLYHNDNVIDNDAYTVLLKGNDLVVKFKNELEDGIYKVVVDSDKILAKNGDVLYGDAEYAFSVNTPNSGLDTYYIGTIGTSADYKTARVPVLGTVGENVIKFLAAVYNNDGSLSVLHTDDLEDGELKFDSLTLSSTQTVKYMLFKNMDTIVPLCESVSNK